MSVPKVNSCGSSATAITRTPSATSSVVGWVCASVAVGLRPEHLLPSSDGPLEFSIELAEPLGADTLLHGRFGDARELVTVRQGGHVTAQPGELRRFSIGATRLHLFDSQSGRRIADA